ncbi:hypothetical protein ACU3L3_06915 [Priestia endophytica]
MLNLAFLGLGGGGGNVAEEALKYGYHVGAINYSQKDLDSLTSIDKAFKLRILGSDGVGHNRDLAIELFTQHHKAVMEFVKQQYQSNDIIAVPFACGGGSGSGLAPIICDILSSTYPDKTIIAMPIVPDLTESTISQLNTLAVFEELSSLEVAVLPVDNQQIKSEFSSIGKDKLYTQSNQKAVYLLHRLFSYTDKYSKNGNFDKRDFMTLFGQTGMTHITEINISNNEKVSEVLCKAWENGVFIAPEKEKVINAAVVFDGEEKLMSQIEHDSLFSYFANGTPIDIFEGNYREKEGENRLIVGLSGLNWCESRLNLIEDAVNNKKEMIEKTFTEDKLPERKQRTSASNFMSKIRQPKKAQVSVSDVLSKYRK